MRSKPHRRIWLGRSGGVGLLRGDLLLGWRLQLVEGDFRAGPGHELRRVRLPGGVQSCSQDQRHHQRGANRGGPPTPHGRPVRHRI